MAKKDKNQTPNVSSVVNRDVIQRLNFLYQASVYLNAIPSSSSSTSAIPSKQSNKPTKKKRVVRRASDLSKGYVQCMKIVGQKATVQMDPTVKRSMCKGCGLVLVPGSTTSVRVKSSVSLGHIVRYTCTQCHTHRRIPAPQVLTHDDAEMAVDDPETITSLEEDPTSSPTKPKAAHSRKRRSRKARVPPLFARKDAGHVVFCGNDVLDGGKTAFGA